jgi:hypothetical protein
MAIVGHFESLAEAQKLVQSELLAGIVQETFEEGQLLQRLPVTVINSKSLLYNREGTLPSAAAYDIHEQIPWTADTNFTQKEISLKIFARQDVLDNFMLKTYRNPNDYRTLILSTLRKGVMRTIEDKLIYGNVDTDSAEFDGVGHLLPADIAGSESWAAANPQAYDMGGASAPVTMRLLRELVDKVRPKPDILLMTRGMRNTLSATAFEKGLVLANANPQIGIGGGPDWFGKRIDYFDGTPITISDYQGGSYGDLSLVVGGDTGGMEFFKVTELADLEDYDAGGIRLVAYCALAQGSSKATAGIHSIDEDGVIVG